jgi:hypothetical protein
VATPGVLTEILAALTPGERLCLLPLSRVLVEDAAWISEDVAILPPEALDGRTLRTVGWPEREYRQSLGNCGSVILEGYVLHWAKSGATRLDLPPRTVDEGPRRAFDPIDADFSARIRSTWPPRRA